MSAVIYNLKQKQGRFAALYHPTTTTRNLQTGKTVRNFTITKIKKVVVAPQRVFISFQYDLAYIAANKNFTYGGLYDLSSRTIIVDRRDLPTGYSPTNNSDEFILEEGRYVVKEFTIIEDKDVILFAVSRVEGYIAYDDAVQDLITAGWSASVRTQVCLDILARTIRNDVFSNSIPTDFFLWPVCGTTFTDALMCLWHPTAIGTSVTNSDFISTDYRELGLHGGLHDALIDEADESTVATKYINTGWLSDGTTTFEDFNFTIFGHNFDYVGTIMGLSVGVTLFGIDSGLLITGYGEDVASAVQSAAQITTGCLSLNSSAANSLELLHDDVSEDTDATVRATAIPAASPFVFAENDDGVAADISGCRICTVCIGPSLTSGQLTTLYNAINTFNDSLGRVSCL